MILEARPEGCCSSTFVLKIDGRPLGSFDGRWFSEGLDISLLGRRRLRLDKLSWLGSHFVLRDEAGQKFAEADRAGVFTSTWDLDLSGGRCTMEKPGWFDSAYTVRYGSAVLANVDRLGLCERGWRVEGHSGLSQEDAILVGLIYHTVLQRQQQAAHGGHAAGS